jgi:hypothetical protein
MHHQSERYRAAVRRKLAAYDRHIQIGLIAQGLLQHLAVTYPRLVWSSFGSWLRTIRPGVCPSELVTAAALRNSLPDFLVASSATSIFTKFLHDNKDRREADRSPTNRYSQVGTRWSIMTVNTAKERKMFRLAESLTFMRLHPSFLGLAQRLQRMYLQRRNRWHSACS